MEKLSPSNHKPPVPRARPPIRNISTPEENDLYSFRNSENVMIKKSVYRSNHQSQDYLDAPNNDDQCTDDEEDYNENNSTNVLLGTSSNSLLSESFSTAHNTPLGPQLHRRSIHSPNISKSFNVTNSSFSHKVKNQPGGQGQARYKFLCIGIIIVAFSIIIVTVQPLFHNDQQISKEIDLVNINNVLDESIQIIQTRFHNQKANIWNDIAAAIYDVTLFPTKPSIIILFGNRTNTLNCLAQLLGQLSGKILGSNDYLTLTPKDFPNDVGQTIHKFQVQILEKKAVVVQDLLSVNVEALKAFHNFCDRESPLVERSIYIITATVDGYKSSQREIEFIEKEIFRRLSNYIEKDILDPLITRLTDGIIVSVVPEPSTYNNHGDCSLFAKNKQ